MDSQVKLLEQDAEVTHGFVEQVTNLGRSLLHEIVTTGKKGQVLFQIALQLFSVGVIAGIKTYDEIILPIVENSANYGDPLFRESQFSKIKKELDDAKKSLNEAKKRHLGEHIKEYEMIEHIRKKEKERRKKPSKNITSSSDGIISK